MNNLISVIIPIIEYNELTNRAIRSVLDQSILPEQLIITVDRFSNESELSYKNKVNNISNFVFNCCSKLECKILTVECNVGPGMARRIAQTNISKNAKWIAFLDSDDFWLPDHLKNFLTWVHNQKIDRSILYFDCYNSVKMPYKKLKFINLLISPRLHTPSAIMSNTNILFNGGRHSEDISYWIELYMNNFDVYCHNIPGSCGRTDRFATGQSNKIAAMAFRKIQFLLSNYFTQYPIQTLIGACYELMIMPTRYFRKR